MNLRLPEFIIYPFYFSARNNKFERTLFFQLLELDTGHSLLGALLCIFVTKNKKANKWNFEFDLFYLFGIWRFIKHRIYK